MEFVKRLPPDAPDDIWDPEGGAEVDEQKLLEAQLLLYEDQYTTDQQTVRVTVGAWNVNQKKPPDPGDLRRWLRLDAEGGAPDVIAVGLQELDMSAAAMLREETPAAAPWRDALRKAAQDQWECVGSRQLVGLYVTVFVRHSLRQHVVGDCELAAVRCGAMGNSMANKGGIGVRLRLYRTSLAFVTAHLAAHMGEIQRRNRDFQRIMDMMDFARSSSAEPVLLRDQERIFFFGDLNYRIELPYDECCALVKEQKWARLLEKDQLRCQLDREDSPYVRMGFRDAEPDFAPTYKYDSGTNRYDTSEKRRVPAWTDRVLWWAPGYGAHDLQSSSGRLSARDPLSLNAFWREELTEHPSDHRPVAAAFTAAVKVEMPEAKERIRRDIQHRMEQVGIEKFALPNIEHDRSDIQFGDVAYGAGPVEEIRLTNNGHAVVLVSVHSYSAERNRSEGAEKGRTVFSNRWLSVSPLQIRVDPRRDGGRDEVLRVQCCIDRGAVAPLHDVGPFKAASDDAQPPVLAHWLLLSAGQQRFFFECTARVAPSCFGSRLDHLSLCGLVPVAQAYLLGPEHQPPPPSRPSVPKELWFMVDYITRYGTKTPDLFQDDLSPEEFQRLRQHLDSRCDGFAEGSFDVHAVGQALLKFLQDLQVPVVIPALHERCLQRLAHAQAQQLVQELPAVHFNVFYYIVAFLRFLLRPDNREGNLLTPELLAQGFGPVLLQREQQEERAGAMYFLLCFIQTEPHPASESRHYKK